MGWNQSEFDELLRKKYENLGAQAAAETTRANAMAQDVAQRQALQQQGDDAAQRRAQLAADTSLQTTGMNNQSSRDIAGIQGQNQLAVTGLQNQGAMDRTVYGADTQKGIAGMEDRTKREQLAQQGAQFDRSFGLDTAKALDTSQRGWADLGRPTYGEREYNTATKQYESVVKTPGAFPTAPNPLESIQSAQSDRAAAAGMGPGASTAGGDPQPATSSTSPASSSSLAGMSDSQLSNLQGQARRDQASSLPASPSPVASSDPSNPRNGLFGDQGRISTTAPAPSPTMSPPANPRAAVTSGPSTFDRVTSALTPPSDSAGMAAARDIGSGLSALGRATGLSTANWGQGFKSLLGGETPEQIRARRQAAAGQ